MSLYELLSWFVIYAFLGWVLEVVYHAVDKGQIVNRGFLNGPVCPVYGFGAVSVFAVLDRIGSEAASNPLIIFLFGAAFATVIELIAGWLLDVLFHARWWDYSDLPFNVHGYICLKFSLLWGIAVLAAVRLLHPLVCRCSTDLIPERIGWWILLVLYGLLISDLVITVLVLLGVNRRFAEIDEVRSAMRSFSDSASEEIAVHAMEADHVLKERREAAQELGNGLKESASVLRNEIAEERAAKKAELLEKEAALKQEVLAMMRQRRWLHAPTILRHVKYPELFHEVKAEEEQKKKARKEL